MMMRLAGACVVLPVSMVHPLPLAAQEGATEFHALDDMATPSLDVQSSAAPLPSPR